MTDLHNIRQPRRSTASMTSVDITVDIPNVGHDLPYTVVQGDPLYDQIMSGEFGEVQPYTAPDFDYTPVITMIARQRLEGPYGEKRESVNNYFTQLAAEKAGGRITDDHQVDLNTLLSAAAWEQSILDRRDQLLQTPNAATVEEAKDPATWPPFPSTAAALVATC